MAAALGLPLHSTASMNCRIIAVATRDQHLASECQSLRRDYSRYRFPAYSSQTAINRNHRPSPLVPARSCVLRSRGSLSELAVLGPKTRLGEPPSAAKWSTGA